jgi:hypothetical protein
MGVASDSGKPGKRLKIGVGAVRATLLDVGYEGYIPTKYVCIFIF